MTEESKSLEFKPSEPEELSDDLLEKARGGDMLNYGWICHKCSNSNANYGVYCDQCGAHM